MITDTRTPAEIAYDRSRLSPVAIDDRIEIAQLVDQALADEVTVTRHTINTDGSIPRDPWTTYDLGDASIDIQDSGGINVCVGCEMLEIEDNAQLRDLVALLGDPRVLAALGR